MNELFKKPHKYPEPTLVILLYLAARLDGLFLVLLNTTSSDILWQWFLAQKFLDYNPQKTRPAQLVVKVSESCSPRMYLVYPALGIAVIERKLTK